VGVAGESCARLFDQPSPRLPPPLKVAANDSGVSSDSAFDKLRMTNSGETAASGPLALQISKDYVSKTDIFTGRGGPGVV